MLEVLTTRRGRLQRDFCDWRRRQSAQTGHGRSQNGLLPSHPFRAFRKDRSVAKFRLTRHPSSGLLSRHL